MRLFFLATAVREQIFIFWVGGGDIQAVEDSEEITIHIHNPSCNFPANELVAVRPLMVHQNASTLQTWLGQEVSTQDLLTLSQGQTS